MSELGLGDAVVVGDPVPRGDVPALLGSVGVLVNNMRPGAPDKAVFEAGACCLPVLVSNPLFDTVVDDLVPPLRFDRDDAAQLAERFRLLGALPEQARREIGHTLRRRVIEHHSVEHWADNVIALARASLR